jgi:hypothetical protein
MASPHRDFVALYPRIIGRAGAYQTTGRRCHAVDPLDQAGRQHSALAIGFAGLLREL